MTARLFTPGQTVRVAYTGYHTEGIVIGYERLTKGWVLVAETAEVRNSGERTDHDADRIEYNAYHPTPCHEDFIVPADGRPLPPGPFETLFR